MREKQLLLVYRKNGDPGTEGQNPDMESLDPEPEQDLSVKSQHLGARRQELAARSAITQPAYSKCAEYFVNFTFKLYK